ncbi:MAG: sulfotransferase [archaeon]
MSELIFLTGLPRSGSTLLCNLLAMHPDITSTPSSPLNQIIQNMKAHWSDDPFLLAQLDNDYENTYKRLKDSTKAFMDNYSNNDTKITVDKNRGWLANAEFVRHLCPQFKMIVCVRDLRTIFASIEKQHKKTMLLDFPDKMSPNDANARADALFANNGVIGGCIKSIENIQDIPNLMPHIFIFRFEDLMVRPQETMDKLFSWLRLESYKIDFNNIKQITFESDSYYRMKYPHTVKTKLEAPNTLETNPVSPRILQTIIAKFDWFYKQYYPEYFASQEQDSVQPLIQNISNQKIEAQVSAEIEKEIGEEIEKNIEKELKEKETIKNKPNKRK